MEQDLDHQIQIARRTTADAFFSLSSQTNTLSRADALWNVHHVGLALSWCRTAQRNLAFTAVCRLFQGQRQARFAVSSWHGPRRSVWKATRTAPPLGCATPSCSAKELFKKATESTTSREG